MPYFNTGVTLSDTQKNKIKKAVKDNTSVKIKLNGVGGPDSLMLTKTQLNALSPSSRGGRGARGKDITLSKTQLNATRKDQEVKGGFLQFLIPAAIGVASSLISGRGVKTTSSNVALRGNGLFLKRGKRLYDVSNIKQGTGAAGSELIGAGIISAIMKIAPSILKPLGIGALTGVASEGVSQIIKKIAGSGVNARGTGLFLKKGKNIYNISSTKEGKGFLDFLKKIPIVGPLIGMLS